MSNTNPFDDMARWARHSAAVFAVLAAIGLIVVVVIGPNDWTAVLLIATVVCVGAGLGLSAFTLGYGDIASEAEEGKTK